MHFIEHKIGRFGYTAISLDDLEASEYTLVQFVIDTSASTSDYRHKLEAMLSSIVAACQHSPCKNNLLLRVVGFGPSPLELHGFKMILQCEPGDYDGVLAADGTTALNDAVLNGVEAAGAFAQYLIKQDFLANGLLIVVTDGIDNHSIAYPTRVKDAFAQATKQFDPCEMTSILVGLCDGQSSAYSETSELLRQFKQSVGFTQYVETDDLSERGFQRLADFVTASINSVNLSIATGGPPTLCEPPARKGVETMRVDLSIDDKAVAGIIDKIRQAVEQIIVDQLQKLRAELPEKSTPPSPPPRPAGVDLPESERLKAVDLRTAILMGKIPEDTGLLIDVKTTAKLLNVSERMVYRLADQNAAPKPIKLGALVRWRLTEIIEWIDSGCPSKWQWPRPRKDRR